MEKKQEVGLAGPIFMMVASLLAISMELMLVRLKGWTAWNVFIIVVWIWIGAIWTTTLQLRLKRKQGKEG